MTSHFSIFLMNNDVDWRSQFFRIAPEVCNQIWEAEADEEDAQFEKRWYYSEDSHSCLQFDYGGCLGNENNFASEEECQVHYQCEFSRFISRYIRYTVVVIFSMVLVRRIWPWNSQHLFTCRILPLYMFLWPIRQVPQVINIKFLPTTSVHYQTKGYGNLQNDY